MRWAETTSASKATPNSSSAVAAAFITGQSESEPITIPTRGPWVDVISHSLALVAEVAAEPGRGVPGALEAVLEVVTVGVDVPDLARGPQVLAVEVHPQPGVAGKRVRVAVVQA